MKSLTDELTERDDDRADMTPMIDCVFLLLLFFIITANFSDESLFEVELPEAETPEVRQPTETVEVYVTRDGEYIIDETIIPGEKLSDQLRGIHETKGIRTMLIKADKHSDYEKVVLIFDIAQALRINEFSLGVQSNE